MSQIETHCSFDQLVPINKIKRNPLNRNQHPKDQIDRLAKIISHFGIRHPLIVSNQSGLLVSGHGRLLAFKKLKIKEAPVKYQDFKDQEEETAFGIADNAIQSWSELDFSGINDDLATLGPDFDLDLLGLKNFTLDISDKEEEPKEVETSSMKFIVCPHCEESFELKQGKKRTV